MKKIILIASAFVIVCLMTVTGIFAGGPSETTNQTASSNNENTMKENAGQNYVDANQDGICDNKDDSNQCQNYVDIDQDGVCDNQTNEQCMSHCQNNDHGNQQCQQNYVDANDDGVCDNYQNNTCLHDGTGRQLGHHRGR